MSSVCSVRKKVKVTLGAGVPKYASIQAAKNQHLVKRDRELSYACMLHLSSGAFAQSKLLCILGILFLIHSSQVKTASRELIPTFSKYLGYLPKTYGR